MDGTVPPGIDYQGVSRFFAQHVPGGQGPLTFQLIGGGRSNLTYLVRGPGGEWVLRRPPLGHVLPTAHDMAREYRVLSALADTDVPVPRPLALCTDAAVNGMPFYVMERKQGVIIEDAIPPGYAETPEERRRLSLALVETLVKLHAVDYQAVGLGDFGRPEGYLERQVRRWWEQWERSKTRDLPAIEEVARRLRAALPAPSPATIVHGDYRLGNLMLAADDPGRVVAILDWEMSTLGDPLTDLAYTLMYWGDPDDPPSRRAAQERAALTAAPGFLRREELTAEYARRSGRDVTALDFYLVLGYYKLAVINEGIYARYLQGKTVGEGFERSSGERTAALVEQALAVADASADPRLRGETG
ncbi:MAG TPA: phosphotransferase family protein [Dehalococcoidia bacterium]